MKEIGWLEDVLPFLDKVRKAIQTVHTPSNEDKDVIFGCQWVVGLAKEKIITVIEMLKRRERNKMLGLVKIQLDRIIEELGVTLDSIQPPGDESDYIERGIRDLEQAVGYINYQAKEEE
jgi:hypothetical protein